MSDEQWRPIPGFDGYEVSDLGRVRSLDRWIERAGGHRYYRRGRVMKVHALPHTGHLNIKLKRQGAVYSNGVHVYVAAAFLGPRPDGMEVCHNNGDPSDNRPTNLRYDSPRENHLDRVRHGTHNMARKTHCRRGHPYDEANTIVRRQGGRECVTCRRAQRRARTVRQRTLAA